MPRLSKTRKELLTAMMKESIFEAATTVLCEHGVDGTTMNRVAAAAKLAKSSLYDYFENKEQLLEFVTDRIVVPFIQAVEETAGADLPAPKKLETILRIALESSIRDRSIIRLLMESNQGSQVKKNSRPRILGAFTAICEQGIREGAFRAQDPAHLGRMFGGCLGELFELQASSESDEAAREYVSALTGVVLQGFSVQGENRVAPGETTACLATAGSGSGNSVRCGSER